MRYVRAREPVALRHPVHGGFEVPNPATAYPEDHELVQAHPWAFVGDDELAEEAERGEGPVEQATRAPGERRRTRRSSG